MIGLLLASLVRSGVSCADTSFVLISVSKLNTLLESSEPVLVLDLRPGIYYLLGHLPGAHNLWRPDYEADETEYPYGGMRASRVKMEWVLSRLGVTDDTHIVLYDERENLDAARFWWLLRLYGHNRVSLLDGGLAAWKKQGNPVHMGKVKMPGPTVYQFRGTPHPEYLADINTVRDHSAEAVILDVRSYEEFTGSKRRSGAFRKGRIPGSVWLEYKGSLGKDGFLEPQALRKLFTGHNVSPDKTVIVYCQSGVRSAHTHFVLSQLLNYPNVKNYDGSWVEWSWHKELPMESGPVLQNASLGTTQ